MMNLNCDSDVLRCTIVQDHIAVVTLNRPQSRNAVNAELTQALEAAVREIDSDDRVRAAILASSHETVFCAGADLVEISAGRADLLSTEAGGFAGFVLAARRKPWLAAVEGAALGGGFELALACDMIIASLTARFGLPEVKRGLFAGAGGAYRLPKRIPRNIALELLATGGILEAPRGYELGLLNRVAEAGSALDAAIVMAAEIAKNAPLSVIETLALARRAGDLPEAELELISARTVKHVFGGEDAAEGSRAFLEKREPVWKGR